MGTPGKVPDCSCHGEPMTQWRDRTKREGYKSWRCKQQHADAERERYAALSGVGYNRLLLLHRRQKALKRMKARA